MQVDLSVTFRNEAAEMLSDLEASLLELEGAPEDMDLVARAFRALHTLKGSGGMAGFVEIVRFAHAVESVFDRVRNGRLAIDKGLLTLSLRAKDHLANLLASGVQADEALGEESDRMIRELQPYLGDSVASVAASGQAARSEPARENAPMATYWIRFQPPEDAIASGMRPLSLLEDLADLGEILTSYRAEAIPPLETIVPDLTYGWWDVILQTSQPESAIHDQFMFVDDSLVRIQSIGLGRVRAADQERLLQVVHAQTDRDRAGVAIQEGVAAIRQEMTKRKPAAASLDTGMRVDAGKLDKLIDMVGELVIIQSRLSMAVKRFHDSSLTQIAEELERLSDGMRGNALGLRMLPIGTIFNSFRRMMRDVADQLGKDVEFVTVGEDTEVDKTMIDRLKDPLLHMLRNAIDHGMETPEARRAAGKSPQGTVRLAADNTCGDVRITIQDDGRGIDPEKVKAKAMAKGLIPSDANPTAKELFNLLFEPGFSTADKVSDLSGRGVGMDVVKKSIDAMRGTIEISSAVGQGSTFAIRLPLTLAIIDGLAVRIGDESFILPLATVEACHERNLHGRERMVESMVRNEHQIPCISLRQLLGVPGDLPGYERVIIAKVDAVEVGLAVDRVVGRQQAVIKSLGGVYSALDWISGTTINGDGGISLILDVPQLVKFAYSRSHKSPVTTLRAS
ncbi:MAG: chemotaxis protein CheA [Magnetococcales bacterium]|nr:chemotaxis protein CheA [Magnetococcales bacterium]